MVILIKNLDYVTSAKYNYLRSFTENLKHLFQPNFPRGRGSNCIFLYKPIEFVIFQGAVVQTPAPSSRSACGIVNWVHPHIVLAKRHSMTLTPLMQVLCGCGKQRQGPTV